MDRMIIEKAFEYGLPTVLVFLLLWGGYKLITAIRSDHRKDYEGVTRRLNEVEDFQKQEMKMTIDRSTIAITENTDALKEMRTVIEKCRGVR